VTQTSYLITVWLGERIMGLVILPKENLIELVPQFPEVLLDEVKVLEAVA